MGDLYGYVGVSLYMSLQLAVILVNKNTIVCGANATAIPFLYKPIRRSNFTRYLPKNSMQSCSSWPCTGLGECGNNAF